MAVHNQYRRAQNGGLRRPQMGIVLWAIASGIILLLAIKFSNLGLGWGVGVYLFSFLMMVCWNLFRKPTSTTTHGVGFSLRGLISKTRDWWAKTKPKLETPAFVLGRIPLATIIAVVIFVGGIASKHALLAAIGPFLFVPLALGLKGTLRKVLVGLWCVIYGTILLILFIAHIQGRL